MYINCNKTSFILPHIFIICRYFHFLSHILYFLSFCSLCNLTSSLVCQASQLVKFCLNLYPVWQYPFTTLRRFAYFLPFISIPQDQSCLYVSVFISIYAKHIPRVRGVMSRVYLTSNSQMYKLVSVGLIVQSVGLEQEMEMSKQIWETPQI